MLNEYYPELACARAKRPTRKQGSRAPTPPRARARSETSALATREARALPLEWLEKDFDGPVGVSEGAYAESLALAKTRSVLPVSWLADEFAPDSER